MLQWTTLVLSRGRWFALTMFWDGDAVAVFIMYSDTINICFAVYWCGQPVDWCIWIRFCFAVYLIWSASRLVYLNQNFSLVSSSVCIRLCTINWKVLASCYHHYYSPVQITEPLVHFHLEGEAGTTVEVSVLQEAETAECRWWASGRYPASSHEV